MDYFTNYETYKSDLNRLYKRMDEDKNLYQLEPYIMRTLDNQEAKGIHNVTLNDPAVFGQRAIAVLSSAYQQTVVEGKGMTDRDTTYVEDFLNAVFWEIDDSLTKKGFTALYPWNCFHVCLRGRIGSRNLIVYNGNKIDFNLLPLDTRYTFYDFGDEGLEFLGYETKRRVSDINQEYGLNLYGTSDRVNDLWSKKENAVLVGGKQVKRKSHDYGEVPCIYVKVPSGSLFLDDNSEEHQGESIYSVNREIYNQLNKISSILMTQTMTSFEPGLIYKSESGARGEPPEKDPRTPGAVTVIGNREDINPIVTSDMRNAARNLLAMLEARAQRGSLSSLDYGNLSFPLSAVAITKLTESKDQIFVPRLQALSIYYQQLARMIIRQYIKKGITAEIGEEGHRKSYEPQRLEGNYTIKFKYFSQSPDQDIANYSIAAAAAPFLSEDTIRRDVLKLQNPDGEKSKKMSEQAEKLDASIMLYRYIKGLIEDERFIEAKILKKKLLAMIKTSNIPVQTESNGKKTQSELLPLLSQGGGGRRVLGNENLEANEQFIREEEKNAQSAEINRTRRAGEGEIEQG